MVVLTIEERWRWWREMGSPRFIMAPMVLQSDVAFRQLARRHGCECCYSPMLPVAAFLASGEEAENPDTGGPASRESWFTTAGSVDRPLLVQLGGSSLPELLEAAQLLQDRCDGIDLNMGCPQRCAEQGHYGALRSLENCGTAVALLLERCGCAAGHRVAHTCEPIANGSPCSIVSEAPTAALCCLQAHSC